VQEVSSESLLIELQTIQHHNDDRQTAMSANAVTVSRLETTKKDIKAAQKAIEDWTKREDALIGMETELKKQLKTMPSIKDSVEVEAKLKALSGTNLAIRRNAQKKEAMATHDRCIEEYSRLGNEIKMVENQKAKKLAETVMPVEGLAILPDGLAYERIPLEQVNQAKKLEVCVAISMALNPKLKVLRINGNDLDTESLLAIGRLVDNQGYQVWIEKVSDDNTIGFYIEDGHLVNEKALEVFEEAVVPLTTDGLSDAIHDALPEIHKAISEG